MHDISYSKYLKKKKLSKNMGLEMLKKYLSFINEHYHIQTKRLINNFLM